MPPPGWARAAVTVSSPPPPTIERLRAASFSFNNANGSQGLIVDPDSTVSVEPMTKHTVKVHKLHFVRLIKMGTTGTRAERMGIRLYVFPSHKSSRTAYLVLQPALIDPMFTVSIISDQNLKECGLQLVSPSRFEHARPPFMHRPPQGATSDPHDVRTVKTASVLSKSKGGLTTLPDCDPSQFSVFVEFLTGEETTLPQTSVSTRPRFVDTRPRCERLEPRSHSRLDN